MQTSKQLLQKIANALNTKYNYGFTVYKETVLSSEGNCFGIGVAFIGDRYVIKFILKKEYATYFCYLDKTNELAFVEDHLVIEYFINTVETILKAQESAIKTINDTWLEDNETLANAIKSSKAICETNGGKYQDASFPYLFCTKEKHHQVNVSAQNRINIKTFDITLEQALKIIKILQE
jgi:hypothetical protein